MKRKLTVALVLLLACVMMLPMFASCASCNGTGNGDGTGTTTAGGDNPPDKPTYERVYFDKSKSYIFKDSVSSLAVNWNPHTYQTNTDSYPAEFLRVGLYGFVFNDALHPSTVKGMEAYKGYTIIPEMAADFPEDVTEAVKALENNKFGIPESATSGYAYKIKLNEKAKWEDGTPINADTYIYSLQKLLDPKLLNYRATDYYAGSFSIAGAEDYANQGKGLRWEFKSIDMTVEEYLAGGGKVEDLILDMNGFWGVTSADGKNYEFVTDDRKVRDPAVEEGKPEDYVSAKHLYETYLAPGQPYAALAGQYLGTGKKSEYPQTFDFANVGLYKTGEYEITLVLAKSLKDFYLLYNLGSNWIVKQDLYEANLKFDETTKTWASTYNTSVASTSSYGPYKLVDYVKDSSMRFVRNDNWYGYTDGKHTYVDPTDNKEYDMYMTTEITTQKVDEATTRKEMFLKGQLMGYGLQSEDFDQYRSSEYCHFTPSETIFFFIFNGHLKAIQQREANDGFDKTKVDLETMTLTSFRKAVAVTYDKEALCTAVNPSRSGGYGIIGNNYIYDPETGAKYRDTEYAKQALCDFYSVDVSKYASLDEAVKSITGYDPVKAKELYNQAFKEALDKGYITSKDGKTSDQTIEITYAASTAPNDFMNKLLAYLNEKMAEVTKGTAFEGKIVFKFSSPLGEQWSDNIKNGMADTVLGGWSGSALDPYGLTDLYCNPGYAYDAGWFDANKVNITIKVDGQDLTMTMYQWSDALNGKAVTVGGKEYNFGYGQADTDTRLLILSKIEGVIMQTYDYIPMIQDAGAALLSKQVYYVVEEYSSVMGRGGIAYMKYNYDETAWKAYVAEQPNGTLSY